MIYNELSAADYLGQIVDEVCAGEEPNTLELFRARPLKERASAGNVDAIAPQPGASGLAKVDTVNRAKASSATGQNQLRRARRSQPGVCEGSMATFCQNSPCAGLSAGTTVTMSHRFKLAKCR